LVRTLEDLNVSAPTKHRVSQLITLRAGPSHRALYFVHPLGGEVLAYRELAAAIRSPLRVLGMRWQPAEDWPPLSAALEQMATIHTMQLRSLQPNGPYLLAGWSFGGVLAYEIAQQLVAAGETVSFLGLLDANPVRDPLTGELTRENSGVSSLARVLDSTAFTQPVSEAHALDLVRSDEYLCRLLGSTIPEGVTAAHLRRNLAITRDSIHAAIHYRPRSYSGPIYLFQAEGASRELRSSLESELRRLAVGEFHHYTVPGSHYSMLRSPFVQTLAQNLDDALRCSFTH
jgi:thioesterase domain-containing protein